MTVNDLFTPRSARHALTAVPAVLMLIVFGRALTTEWFFYRILFGIAILSVLSCAACIVLDGAKKWSNLYSVVSMLSHLLFIPMFCSTVLMILFAVLYLFGIDLHPLS